ncbi:MAG: hypothetical protein U1E89_21275 [Burkholderiaceae bacterium]
MSSDSDTGAAAIASRSAFTQAALTLLTALPESKPRQLLIVDADFGPWPLGEAAVVDALTQWARLPGRHLRLMGLRFDVLERDQPRLAVWRRHFAHVLECCTPTDVEATDMPSLLLADGAALELVDRERFVARRTDDRRALVLLRERTDALLQRSQPAWPVTNLGL